MEGLALRRRATRRAREAFNVVSRLSDIRDILAGLEVVYDGRRAGRRDGRRRSARRRPGRSSSDLRAFIADLHDREQAGKRFTPEQADTLGTEAQERATAIAGQVSQAAAQLGVQIEQ